MTGAPDRTGARAWWVEADRHYTNDSPSSPSGTVLPSAASALGITSTVRRGRPKRWRWSRRWGFAAFVRRTADRPSRAS